MPSVKLPFPSGMKRMRSAFWDFCQEHPDYATLLLRETFDADNSTLVGEGGPAREVVAACIGYVVAAQARSELPAFDVEAFSLWVASYMLSYHGAPGLRNAYPGYRVPKLGGQHEQYRAAALQAYKARQRAHPTMQVQADDLSDQDMADIAAFFAALGGGR